MAIQKKIAVNSDKSGRIILPNTKVSKSVKGETAEARRSVIALYPLEPTTIKKTVLDRTISSVIDKRLCRKK